MIPRIGILHYPGAQAAAVLGLRDLLETAVRLHAMSGVEAGLEVRVLAMESRAPRLTTPLTVVVLPPSLNTAAPVRDAHLAGWLRRQHARGTILCSICVGAFLLAETGLLDGRPATTHWALEAEFAARFPRVQVDADRLIIDDDDVITAGGLMAWVDLGLLFVHRFLGPTTMLATARQLLVDPGGREQRFYRVFAPVFTHGDDAILKAQRWLAAKSGEKVDVPRMAAVAHLGERTFLRRFQSATGMRPTEYLQHLRVGKARELLERSNDSVEAIGARVGYDDPSAFRKTFQRLLGLAPSEYRQRFTPLGVRASLR
jgi:transcriptional regulator GlxA family with amidase domain